MRANSFFDFGKELARDFQVHENCYDCVELYEGCTGWRAEMAFACKTVNPLPDVPAGTTGQPWPAARRKTRRPSKDRLSESRRVYQRELMRKRRHPGVNGKISVGP